MSDTLQHEFSGSVLKMLIFINGRYDRDHSLSYTLEDALMNGLKAIQRSKEYSETTKNRKLYDAAIAADPTIILRPDKLLALMKKYGIGHSNAKLEQQVLEAAEAMQKAAQAKAAEAELAELEKATAPAPKADAKAA